MKPLELPQACPGCTKAMRVAAVACADCGTELRGQFRNNEFAQLGDENLHFLRIFLHCEGNLREMEAALGMSYPTLKNRLAALKDRLFIFGGVPKGAATPARDLVESLERGEISFDDAIKKLKALRKKEPKS